MLSGAIPADGDREGMVVAATIYSVGAVLTFFASIFLIFAGSRCLKYRGRVLGIIACVLCILSCGLPGMGVGIYGLVILCQNEVGKLFEERGRA